MQFLNCRRAIVVHIFFIYIFSLNAIYGKKKEAEVLDFLAKELKALEASADCPLKQLTKHSVRSLWLKDQLSDETLLCILKFLDANNKDDSAWSLLGTSFEKKNLKQQADYCFKQATKAAGKYTPFVKDWWFIGPFVIGKTEFDGDVLAAYGGIQNVSRYRYHSETFVSELSSGGTVKWTELKQSSAQELLKINPKVDWNDLVSSLGSMGITEWQGWAVGEFFINENDLQLSFQCLGVAKCSIGNTMLVGDLYHRNQFWFPAALSRGVYTVFIPLRTKVVANFKFSVNKMPAFQVLEPSFLPDVYNGYLPINFYLSIPVSNLMADKWLKVTKIKITTQSDGQPLDPVLISNDYEIAPGQVRPVVVHLKPESVSDARKITDSCRDLNLEFKLLTSEGSQSFKLTLRCRHKGSSFLFSFIDHDGSVQHAAAVEPLGACNNEACPVFLTLHGTTVPPQNQADSYKKMVNGEYQFGIKGMWLLAPTRHGAHNWEGPGAMTAISALQALSSMTLASEWFSVRADSDKVLFAGHSMGGHGAWHLATHFPDRTIGLISLAGWIKKEEYGESNLFFRHDISTSHTDASVKAIMEACIGENDADKHVTNLKGISVLARIGAEDRTVHPFFVRRMVRLLKEARVNVTYSELPNLAHWWWDTKEANDGGCVNDAQIRQFIDHISATSSQLDNYCSAGSQECGTSSNRYKSLQPEPVTLVTINPAFGDGLKGIAVLQQIIPLRISTVQVHNKFLFFFYPAFFF
ncbi:unnamed protein product [Candidula unifasciata]|uniref:Peptidase S9 prolyl oligopeptidase catalytic domain-containing protein n=1 Tax=Candidula unifasciata TaxID=100452 RepID=A0A8S3Z1F9_9EUPU|nr:unnamed protein product [Candidula unifasciata]